MPCQSPRLWKSTWVSVSHNAGHAGAAGRVQRRGIARACPMDLFERQHGLLVLADNSAREERLVLDRTLLAALDHFGMPIEVLDLAGGKLTTEVLQSHSALVSLRAAWHRLSEDSRRDQRGDRGGNGPGKLRRHPFRLPTAYRQMLGVESAAAARTPRSRLRPYASHHAYL